MISLIISVVSENKENFTSKHTYGHNVWRVRTHGQDEKRGAGLYIQLQSGSPRRQLLHHAAGRRLPDAVHDALQLMKLVEEGEDLRVEAVRVHVDDGGHPNPIWIVIQWCRHIHIQS